MFPELFEIPIIHLTVKSYGLMMVLAFLTAVYLIRRLSRNITPDPQMITNAALYALIAGIFGSRLFYVVHHFDQFRGRLFSVFAVWQGGLELLGGVLLAIAVIALYCRRHKLPVRRYLDILAVGLMAALAVGRIGCFLNGCCFGKPTNLPWAVRFPYGSFVYRSQIYPNLERNRPEPQLVLPDDFFGYYNENGVWSQGLKPKKYLSQWQKQMVENGKYRCLPVHPTQLYSSANGAVLCFLLYLFWRRSKVGNGLFAAPGCTFSLMFILYGFTRFFIEFVRDDNPYEFDGITISQNVCIVMILLGVVLMVIFQKMKPKIITNNQ
ncbi:MAG: prolipoprotein diacylglyceryl transferase [Planctomycetota bacterium]|nr:MAG: prolipoprotein diacylglyceryl transferase [Planctomycetota bacterium]